MRRVRIACVLALALAARAQSPGQSGPLTTEDALHAMSQQAAVIFAGQVVSVRQRGGATGVIEIEFAVDDAIRGVRGGAYILREWAGLSPAGESPFRAGQHYLMLLHAPGASGLSSPIGGADGAIPIRGGNPSAGAVVDLRWVATLVVQPVSYRLRPIARPTGLPVIAQPNAKVEDTPRGDVTNAAPYVTVLTLLRNWEKTDAAR
jgi:hypothetical protein